MKKYNYPKFIYLFFTLLIAHMSFGQETYESTYECDNYNAFLTGDSIESLMYYTDTIYPSGILNFDLTKSGEINGIESLYPLLEIGQGTTFGLVRVTPGLFDEDKNYYKYQQYYQGLEVEGGGYSALIFGDPGDPCEMAFMMSVHIASDIDVSVTPGIDSTALDTILSHEDGIKPELVISLNLLNDCEYHLAWRTFYTDGDSKISWVDAHTGTILKTTEAYASLNAPTQVYGTQDLDDSFVAGAQSLTSSDGRTRTFDFEPSSPNCPTKAEQIDDDLSLIPTTTNTVWTTEADSAVYQAHHVVTTILPILDGLGIKFTKVDVAVCNTIGAFSHDNGGRDSIEAFLIFGRVAGMSTALYDVAGHEIMHGFLHDILGTDQVGNSTLHEGISDMIGTYVESVIQGNVDWVIGDDVAAVAAATGRDLQNPAFDCLNDNVPNGQHIRSTPLSHWFYMISTGDSLGVPGLGIEAATQLVVEALNLLGPNADYEQLKDATEALIDEEFGACSPVSRTVRRAWQEICIPTATCSFQIVGEANVCEEGDSLHLFLSGSLPGGVTFNWVYPYEWTAEGCSPGSPTNGICLNVTDFPKYNWYPQYFQVRAILIGSGISKSRTVKLRDCLGDDPTCEEYHNAQSGQNALIGGSSTVGHLSGVGYKPVGLSNGEPQLLKVFDMNGRPIYSGAPENFQKNLLPYRGLFIFTYFDENALPVKSEKIVFMN